MSMHRRVIEIDGEEVGAHMVGDIVTICPSMDVADGTEFTYAGRRLKVVSSRDPYATYKTRPDPTWSEQRRAEWDANEKMRSIQGVVDRGMAGKFLEMTVTDVDPVGPASQTI